jgi:hypothetical protein
MQKPQLRRFWNLKQTRWATPMSSIFVNINGVRISLTKEILFVLMIRVRHVAFASCDSQLSVTSLAFCPCPKMSELLHHDKTKINNIKQVIWFMLPYRKILHDITCFESVCHNRKGLSILLRIRCAVCIHTVISETLYHLSSLHNLGMSRHIHR